MSAAFHPKKWRDWCFSEDMEMVRGSERGW